jgi:hypothetical protein
MKCEPPKFFLRNPRSSEWGGCQKYHTPPGCDGAWVMIFTVRSALELRRAAEAVRILAVGTVVDGPAAHAGF